uniref:Peptidase M48 Ste24p n=1 Tax=Cyanothece sp. (strain PCC 7425 / ATCC 29141) TaxID=395961 RepID=B8HYI3_CYAP4
MLHLRSRRAGYRCFCLLLAIVTAFSAWFSHPVLAQGVLQRMLMQGVEVIQLSTLSPAHEMRMGQQIQAQMLRQGMRLYPDPALNRYISRIGQRLVAVSDRPRLTHRFQVIRDPKVNAFATMGGFVYVTTGLLLAADNEAQLASVLAHEIGHVDGRHLIGQMRQVAIARGLITAVGLEDNTAVNLGAELVLRRPRSRQDEFDADQRGVRLLSRAGYAESAMPMFLSKLMTARTLPAFFSTHPAVADRVTALEQLIEQDGQDCTTTAETTCGLNDAAYQEYMRRLLKA